MKKLIVPISLVVMALAVAAMLPALVSAETSSTRDSCYTFSKNFGVGSEGEHVTRLTQALIKDGVLSNVEKIFDEDLAGAIVKFQNKYGIPTTGYVGPLTRAKLNSLYGCGTQGNSTSVRYECPPGYICTPSGQTTNAVVCPAGYTCSPNSSIPEQPYVSGMIKCVFNGSMKNEKCYSTDGRFYFNGTGSTGGVIYGRLGSSMTWKSTCGGSVNTTNDGGNAYANFTCSSPQGTSEPTSICPTGYICTTQTAPIQSPETPFIAITSPVGGQAYEVGNRMAVQWRSSGIPSSQNLDVIRLRSVATGQEYYLASGVPNNGDVLLLVPSLDAGQYTLEIKSSIPGFSGAVMAQSAVFDISAAVLPGSRDAVRQ